MAAPTVGAVMADILPYLGVERTEDPGLQQVLVEDLVGDTLEEAQKKLAALGLTAKTLGQGDMVADQIPSPGQSLPGGSEVLLYLREKTDDERQD